MNGRSSRVGVWIAIGVLVHVTLLLLIEFRWGIDTLLPLHDAGFYITQLQDPLLTGDLPDWYDNIPYRGLRIGYVLLALPFRWLGPIPALMTANLIAVGTGVWAIMTIARRHGVDPRWAALAWILNPGAIIATALLLPDTIAWAAILLSIIALERRRWVAAVLLGVFAVATKEASLAALAMVAVAGFKRDRRTSLPFAAGIAWHLVFLSYWVSRYGSSFHSEFISMPFKGWIDAWRLGWDNRPISQFAAFLVLCCGVVVLVMWWRRRSSLYLAAAAGQALLMIVVDYEILIPISNSVRVGGLFLPILVACCLGASTPEPESIERPASLVG